MDDMTIAWLQELGFDLILEEEKPPEKFFTPLEVEFMVSKIGLEA